MTKMASRNKCQPMISWTPSTNLGMITRVIRQISNVQEVNMIELRDQPVKVAVPMEEPARNRVDLLAAAQVHTNRVVLHLEGIDYDQNPGVNYEVYINLPLGQQPNYQSDYY